MLFERRLREGINRDQITLAFRRWSRSQVLIGHRYRTGLDIIEVESLDRVTATDIDSAQAVEAGYATVEDLLADLRGPEEIPLYRIGFRRLDEPDPRAGLASAASLTSDEAASISASLARLDRSSSHGPWTLTLLIQIAAHPAAPSRVLSDLMDWAQPDLKRRVRSLTELGLTTSLRVGYRLSPCGETYLKMVESQDPRTAL